MNVQNNKVNTDRSKWWFVPLTLIATLGLVFALSGCGSSSDTASSDSSTDTASEQPTKPEDSTELTDLAIGTSATINGVTVTVNSVTEGKPTATGSPTLEVSVTYVNNHGANINISPYDWSTVLRTGSDKAHVGGDVSFSLDTLSDGKEWTGIVTLWNDEEPEKIKFESSFLNLGGEDKEITWVLG